MVISMSSEDLDYFSPPARFIVRCIADLLKHSCLAAFFDRRLVLDPEFNIARISIKFPFLSMTLTFWTGHKPVRGLNSLFWCTAFPWMLLLFDVVGTSWNWLWNGTAFGLKLKLGDSNFSLCRHQWWFFFCIYHRLSHQLSYNHLCDVLLDTCSTSSSAWWSPIFDSLLNSGIKGRQQGDVLFYKQEDMFHCQLLHHWQHDYLTSLSPFLRGFPSLSSVPVSQFPLEQILASWCNQPIRLLTLSSFLALASLFQNLSCLLDWVWTKVVT